MNPLQQEVMELKKRLEALESKSDRFIFEKDIQMFDGRNIVLSPNTGTKIGTSSTQKLSFYGSTPVIQQTTTGRDGFSIGVAATVRFDSTFPSGVGGTKYTIGDVVAALQAYGLLPA